MKNKDRQWKQEQTPYLPSVTSRQDEPIICIRSASSDIHVDRTFSTHTCLGWSIGNSRDWTWENSQRAPLQYLRSQEEDPSDLEQEIKGVRNHDVLQQVSVLSRSRKIIKNIMLCVIIDASFLDDYDGRCEISGRLDYLTCRLQLHPSPGLWQWLPHALVLPYSSF